MRPAVGVCLRESQNPKEKVMMVLVLGHSGRPMVISSGMQSMDTMKQVYQIVKPLNPNFCFLQCTSAYPLPPEDVNLRVIAVSRPLSDRATAKWRFLSHLLWESWGRSCSQSSNES